MRSLTAEAELGPRITPVLKSIGETMSAGHGVQAGPLRPDYGDDWCELECDRCGATWVGREGAMCYWCCVSLMKMQDEQRDLALTPPDLAVDDKARPNALLQWGRRMKVHVESGLITKEEAERVYKRELARTR